MNDLENLELDESFENIETFRNQSLENQRFDLLGLVSQLQEYANQVAKDCEYLENRIDTIHDAKELLKEINYQTNIYGSLSYGVMQVDKKFKRLNSFIKIYLTNKNIEP